jgi:hypothetical protein
VPEDDGEDALDREPVAPATRARNITVNPDTRGIAAVVERVEHCEHWLASGMSPRRAAKQAQEPLPRGLGLSRWAANRYVGTALERLKQDDSLEPIESKRARIVAMLHAQIERALAQKRQWVHDGQVQEYDAPDLKAANTAIGLLAEIEGVKKPVK